VPAVTGAEREALWLPGFDVKDEVRVIPGTVERYVDEERAALDGAEQQIAVAGHELPSRKAHRGAACAAATRLDEHDRVAPVGAQAA
jgi:hypothetical protein